MPTVQPKLVKQLVNAQALQKNEVNVLRNQFDIDIQIVSHSKTKLHAFKKLIDHVYGSINMKILMEQQMVVVVYQSELIIISTGICIWDEQSNNCRDQQCTDLYGINHQQCYQQISTCTSDGTKCLLKETCSQYKNEVVCTKAIGTDGICLWDNNQNAQYRLITYADISNGISNDICSSSLSICISNGTVYCIPKSNCSLYKTENICPKQIGVDGTRYQEKGTVKINNNSKFRLLTFTDIQNGRTTKICQAVQNLVFLMEYFVFLGQIILCIQAKQPAIQGFGLNLCFYLIYKFQGNSWNCTCTQQKNVQKQIMIRMLVKVIPINVLLIYVKQIMKQTVLVRDFMIGITKKLQYCKIAGGQCIAIDPLNLSYNDCLNICLYIHLDCTNKYWLVMQCIKLK